MNRWTPRLVCLFAAIVTVAIDRRGAELVLLLVGAAGLGTVLVLALAAVLADRWRKI